ncbi:unnamed protein product, partial [Polarella glacialis]
SSNNSDCSRVGAQLWSLDLEDPNIPVGTNHMEIYQQTKRSLTPIGCSLPPLCVMVFACSGTAGGYVGCQAPSLASKLVIRDVSDSPPAPIILDSLQFDDTNMAAQAVQGTIRWSFNRYTDTAFLTHVVVYLAEDELGT